MASQPCESETSHSPSDSPILSCFSYSHTHNHTHTHTHTRSHTHIHSLTLTFALTHTNTLALTLSHSNSHSLSLSHTDTDTHSHFTFTLTLTHTLTHTHALAHTHTDTLSVSRSHGPGLLSCWCSHPCVARASRPLFHTTDKHTQTTHIHTHTQHAELIESWVLMQTATYRICKRTYAPWLWRTWSSVQVVNLDRYVVMSFTVAPPGCVDSHTASTPAMAASESIWLSPAAVHRYILHTIAYLQNILYIHIHIYI